MYTIVRLRYVSVSVQDYRIFTRSFPGRMQRSGMRSGVQRKELRSSEFRMDNYTVYILASGRNGTLYVGVTNNLARRIFEHKQKVVPGFTRRYGVDRLVWYEHYRSIGEARQRETSLKRWRRAWKLSLVEAMNPALRRSERPPQRLITPSPAAPSRGWRRASSPG
ncbi:GIY-YIG nuclease family protein [Chelatococcus sp. CO-6]|uniref:GIY-YIG nuclease family protein n=1 Tax=Chelatococcus sp. CO-6 TaxID=1702325 RepID=UPI0026AFB3EE